LATTLPARTITAARDLRSTLRSYIQLTKPRIIGLLVVTTIPAMVLAEGGVPSLWLIAATVLGGSVVAGGANAMNMYFDRDIDEIMLRTQERPVPAGQVEPERAAIFGFALGALGFGFMWLTVNPLAALMTIGAFAFYVIVYTLVLKRSTSMNIVIGGAAGALPPAIGWAAVTNSVSIEAILMFAVVTMWTPPHFWAISINYNSDYKRAGVPMLPVVAGVEATKRQMFWYTLGLVAITIALGVFSDLGALYMASAGLLGAGFLYFTFSLWRSQSVRPARAVFVYSILYLALLFAAIAADTLVRS
jgi:protoheme IX farnesyltransferase